LILCVCKRLGCCKKRLIRRIFEALCIGIGSQQDWDLFEKREVLRAVDRVRNWKIRSLKVEEG